MSKRTLLMVVSIVASLAMVASGTLAYLSDSDMDTNVMVLGNVDIVQNEQERTEDGELDQFTQNQPAYPAVGPIDWADEGVEIGGTEYLVFTDELENVIDKFVTVTNTGKSDAYIRTIILIEAPEYDPNNLIHVNVNGDISNTPWAPVDIDGVEYVYSVFTYPEALAAGETSVPSLMQLFLDSKTTNEDVAKFGDTWEVHAISQAVQTNGFDDAQTALDTAFGEVTAENLQKWVAETPVGSPGTENDTNNPPIVVDTVDEFSDALAEGGDVKVAADLTTVATVPAGETAIDLDQHTLNGSLSLEDGADLSVESGSIINTNDANSAIAVPAGATLELTDVVIESARHGVRAEGGDVTINSGSYKIVPNSNKTLHAVNVSDGSTVTINGGTFVGPKGTIADSGAAVNVQAGSTVIINGGNFSGGKNNTLSSKGTLTIYGGTFDQDPTQYVADGYKVTKTGNLYVVSAE